MEMANIHINQDLRMALKLHGYGTDEDWKCIGDVVMKATKEHYDALEIAMSKVGSKILGVDMLDVPTMRDGMRDEIKENTGNDGQFIQN